MRTRPLAGLVAATALGLGVLAPNLPAAAAEPAVAPAEAIANAPKVTDIVPAPLDANPSQQDGYALSPFTFVKVEPGSAEARQVGEYLADQLRPVLGHRPPVVPSKAWFLPGITLDIGAKDPRVGPKGYQLDSDRHGVRIAANSGDGLFSGVQSLRQLLPAKQQRHGEPKRIAAGSIVDAPRFEYRGAHLDLARHFHTPDEVKKYLDYLAQYKINYLHLHLTDDQGWRIQIDSWPELAPKGGGPGTGVDGVGGGYLTKADYADLNAYAASRHITIVPEIDMPGHTNAAQSVYGELNCDGKPVPPRTDIEVGYSSLCIDKEITYKFVEDVIRELAAMTPGPYLHIGGDEAHATKPEEYQRFMDRVIPLAAKYGKRPFGWHEIAKTNPPTSVVPQFWDTTTENAAVAAAAARGNKILMSPANKTYLDMKYNPNTPLGLKWAGYIEVKDAYEWNPGNYVAGVGEQSVLGVEAPLWSETLRKLDDIEFMAFPRLPAIAELGWSAWSTHDWESFRQRLAAQGPRWEAQGIDYWRSPQIPWPTR